MFVWVCDREVGFGCWVSAYLEVGVSWCKLV